MAAEQLGVTSAEEDVAIAKNLLAMAERDKLSIRELYKRMAAGNSGYLLVGTAEDIVDSMQSWFEAGAADGFNICPATLPQGMDDLSEFILPELRKRGLFRTDYESGTLRGNLGLQPLRYGD